MILWHFQIRPIVLTPVRHCVVHSLAGVLHVVPEEAKHRLKQTNRCLVELPVISSLPPEHPVGVAADGAPPALHLEHHPRHALGALPVGRLLVQGRMVERSLCALLNILVKKHLQHFIFIRN